MYVADTTIDTPSGGAPALAQQQPTPFVCGPPCSASHRRARRSRSPTATALSSLFRTCHHRFGSDFDRQSTGVAKAPLMWTRIL